MSSGPLLPPILGAPPIDQLARPTLDRIAQIGAQDPTALSSPEAMGAGSFAAPETPSAFVPPAQPGASTVEEVDLSDLPEIPTSDMIASAEPAALEAMRGRIQEIRDFGAEKSGFGTLLFRPSTHRARIAARHPRTQMALAQADLAIAAREDEIMRARSEAARAQGVREQRALAGAMVAGGQTMSPRQQAAFAGAGGQMSPDPRQFVGVPREEALFQTTAMGMMPREDAAELRQQMGQQLEEDERGFRRNLDTLKHRLEVDRFAEERRKALMEDQKYMETKRVELGELGIPSNLINSYIGYVVNGPSADEKELARQTAAIKTVDLVRGADNNFQVALSRLKDLEALQETKLLDRDIIKPMNDAILESLRGMLANDFTRMGLNKEQLEQALAVLAGVGNPSDTDVEKVERAEGVFETIYNRFQDTPMSVGGIPAGIGMIPGLGLVPEDPFGAISRGAQSAASSVLGGLESAQRSVGNFLAQPPLFPSRFNPPQTPARKRKEK